VVRNTEPPVVGGRLQTLYAQYVRVTLAPSVLPRLLARIWPGLCGCDTPGSKDRNRHFLPGGGGYSPRTNFLPGVVIYVTDQLGDPVK